MPTVASSVIAVALALLALTPTPAPARTPRGPTNDAAFYAPPARLVPGRPGSLVWGRFAAPPVAVPQARRTLTVIYRSVDVRGRPTVMSASVALPRRDPPAGGWRTVVFDHVTTGAADRCAPTRVVRRGNTEYERMTRSATITGKLLDAGLVVVRPDYEGVGTPGPHPYLVGSSLARAGIDAMRAARHVDRRISSIWAVAGHSEGGVGALFTGELAPRIAPELSLRAVAAFAPPTHAHELIEAASKIVVDGPGIDGLSSLGALIVTGAGTADPDLEALLHTGALSPAAVALLPDIERRCLADLTLHDSWGGLAPAEIPGPRLEEAKPLLYRILDASDPRNVRIPAGLPVRLDQGVMDLVVPFALTDELAVDLQRAGVDLTYTRWPTASHVTITDADQAAQPATDWLVARLR